MELPLGGPALRHYTQSRPRPHRQKLNYRPSRPQETIIESENEVLELMGRVDEGVEEFFTKRVLPTDVLKKEDEESITIQEMAPASSIPCPPPTKTLRRKLGEFFTLKKRRGLKSETSHEGRPKKASIADFIRPLREVARAEKEKDRVKEPDKENEKEKGKEHPSAGELAVQETPASGAPLLRGEAAPPRRALREGKSQSLILLSGSAATGTPNARNTAKKQFEGQHSFEQKLHLMLQRIGVSKPPPEETQNQEGEMKKAESEGTIIDSKPEPSASFSKPRTMSASSDTRHQIRPSVSAHESAGKPALPPKPVIKPGPPPTTSSRNTPENELDHIQEGETSTSTTHSPTVTPSPPAAPALTATTTTTTTVLTISDSIPDSTSFTIPSSSTVTPADTDICTDSVNITAAAITPTNVTELDSKAYDDSSPTTEQPTATIPTTLTSPTTPTEPLATVSVTSTSSNLITQTLPVTSNSSTIATPSNTTLETVSNVSNESSVFTILPNLSTESTLPEFNGDPSSDSTPAVDGSDTTTVVITAFSPTTISSDMPSGLVTTTDLINETIEDSSLITSTNCETLVSSITKTTSSSNSSDTIKATVSSDATSSTPISVAPPPTSSTSFTTTSTRSPTSTDCMNSISASNINHPITLTHTDISTPSTSSGLTNPTDTTSTATSLNHADTNSTTSSTITPAISSKQLTDSIYGLPVTDATSCHLTSPAHSTDSPGQNNIVQTSPEEPSSVQSMEKAEEELEMVHKSKQTELDKNKGVVDEKMNGKPLLTSSAETTKEVQKESEKAKDDTMVEPPPGNEGLCHTDERVEAGQKQEEAKSVSEK